MEGLKKTIIGVLIVLCVVFLGSKILFAELNVPEEYSTIQEAINAASDNDEIIVQPGIYYENINFLGKAITVRSIDTNDPNMVASTIIDGNNSGTVIVFETAEIKNSVLNGLTVQGGKNSIYGGGIYCNSSSPAIKNCVITKNFSGYDGGGINCVNSSSPTIENCVITKNFSGDDGGGINCADSSSPMIINCNITGNSALLNGGGVYCDRGSSPTITNCILWNNTPDEIIVKDGSPIVTYSDIQNGYTGIGNIDKNPLFIDAIACDFHLNLNSPCIDTGDPNSLIFEDKDGLTRPQDGDGDGVAICDMGAYESPRLNTYYQDADEDGYGDPNTPLQSCFQPDDYVPDGTDCLDSDPNIHPTAIEYTDGKDNDCDGQVDEPNDLTNGLLAYYPFNGNANDESGNRNHGTVFGASLIEDRFGNPNSAYSFDGIDDYILIGEMGDTSKNGTIVFWMYPTSVDNFRNPFSTFINGDNEAIEFQEHYGKLVVAIGSSESGFRYYEYDNIHANAFYYVVLSWDKETNICKGWLNGVKKFETTHRLWPSLFINIGVGTCSTNYSSCCFKGTIDDIRIYNRTLFEAEIQELYCEGLPSQTYYLDADEDGYGNPNYTIQDCVIHPGYVENKDDCNDKDPEIYLGALEQCDGKDNDCDGKIDLLYSETGLLLCSEAAFVWIENAKGSPGQIQVVVPIKIERATGLAGADIILSYDPEILTVREVRPRYIILGFLIQSHIDQDKGIVSLMMANATGITEDSGILAEIIFGVSESAQIGTISSLVFEEMIAYYEDTEPMDIITQNGEFEVICDKTIYYRDLDMDGFGDTWDSRCLDAQDPYGIYTALVSGDLNDDDPAIFPRTLRVLDVQGYPGQTQVKVLIEVEDSAQITEAGFVLKYDPNVLIAKEVRPPLIDGLFTQTDIDIFPVGDQNGDWYVNVEDVTFVTDCFLYCCCMPGFTSEECSGADLNQDGMIDIIDIILNVNIMLYGSYTQSNINQAEGEVYWKTFSAKGLSSDSGILVEIIFDVSESAKLGTVIPLILKETYIYINLEDADLCGALTTDGEFLIVEEGYKGDLNKDKDITSADAIIILRCAVGLSICDEYQIWAGDVNEDGYINSADAILVLKGAGGIPTIFCSRPKNGQPDDMVTILGWNFGNIQGVSGVFFGDILKESGTWSNHKIITAVPSGIEPGPVYISIDTTEDISNLYRFIIGEEQMTRYRGFDPHFKLADNTRTIYVPSDLIAAPCEQIVIPIVIDDAAGIAGMDLVLDFNPDVLIPVEAECASLTEGFLLGMNDSGEGSLMISLASPTGITEGNGALVDLVFEVSPDAQEFDSTSLIIYSLRAYDENAETIEGITSINGYFAVKEEGNCPPPPTNKSKLVDFYYIFDDYIYIYYPAYYPWFVTPFFPQGNLGWGWLNPVTNYNLNSYDYRYGSLNLNGWTGRIEPASYHSIEKYYSDYQSIYHWPAYYYWFHE